MNGHINFDSLEGGSTNFMTNTVKLRLPLDDFPLLMIPTLRHSAANVFLHESIHHWCFKSHFGNALTMLKLLAYEHSHKGETDPALECAFRFRYSLALFRPLLEGMATFGEFDAFHPPTSRSPIPPFGPLALLFYREPHIEAMEDLTIGQAVGTALSEIRRYKCFVDAKQRLLSELHEGDAVNYFVGYQTIKRLWRDAYLSDSRFLDTEFFLDTAYHYFLSDYEFSRLLLDFELSPESVAAKLNRRLQMRIERFSTILRNRKLVSALYEVRAKPGNSISLGKMMSL